MLDTKVDIYFLLILIILSSAGIIMMGSASYAVALKEHSDSYYYFKKQLTWLIVGFIAMLIISLIDYRVLKKKLFGKLALPWLAYGASAFLLILVLFAPKDANNIQRHLYIGGFQFQPSEFTKFAMILFFAYFAEKFYSRMNTAKYGFWYFLIMLAPPLVLLFRQPHVSAIVIITIIMFAMLFISGGFKGKNLLWYGLAVVGIGVPGVILMWEKIGHVRTRIELWQNPFANPRGDGYQTVQSIYAVGSGGVFGVGFGNSRQKLLYLPEPQNDFVFSIVCEELGFLGAVIILICFALLVFRGLRIAAKANDKFGAFLAFGIVIQVGVQAVLNIAVVTNALPNTGISLPFFSYGGTALLMLLAQMGVVLSVSRTSTVKKA
jgi:cell division protein FtsW